MQITKIYCPSCGQSREPSSGDTYAFKMCDRCIAFRDKKYEHSEKDIQEEIQKNIDKTIRRSIR